MYDAIVPAGGAARRLGGVDKPGVDVAGRTLLDRVLDAVPDAGVVVCVGPERATERSVTWTREAPPGGGPVAAVAAGLALTSGDRLVVLAADLPGVAPAVPALLAALADADQAVLVDPDGRANFLCAAWRRPVLVAALAAMGDPVGAPMRALAAGRVITVPDPAGWGADCDTWDAVAAARARLST